MTVQEVTISAEEKVKYWVNLAIFHVVIFVWAFYMGWLGYEKNAAMGFQFGLWTMAFSLVLVSRSVYLNAPKYMTFGYHATYAWGGLAIAAVITLVGALVFKYAPYTAPAPLAAALWTAIPAALGGWLWAEIWPFLEAQDPRDQLRG